ncbi:MAG: cell division protein FtsL [Nitrosomonadaceae bacterium]|jgi:cell division protein FtsL|uniref:cell division protein FtsL n=1 Tax=Nitrosomonas oligotropha TaxID=42354 RepID=UPI00104A4425|nr:cell division protein FtsL [Nitrosomonas oligotropha]MXS81872.1 cell division protein FtsL [Nitrosomonas oligotropha]NBQ69132.1 cell division protein FtsL [Nitrosomonadaceae bacterium]UJP01217.1 MAG: cell division protein FtsL [Nitrosomonas sp.]
MFKLNIFLVFILIASALGVVTSQHMVRKLFMALENEKGIERKLDVEWGRLQLEQSTLIMHGRIEQIAKERLNMTVPAASSIQIVSINDAENRLNTEGLKP